MKALEFIGLFNEKAQNIGFPYQLSYPSFTPPKGQVVITPERKSFAIVFNQETQDISLIDIYHSQDGRGLVLAAMLIQLCCNSSEEKTNEALAELGLLNLSFLEGKETFINEDGIQYHLHAGVTSAGFVFQIRKE